MALMEESGDIAGTSATEVNLADAEVLLADLPAALNWLNRALAFYPVPGDHRALGWLHLFGATCCGNSATLRAPQGQRQRRTRCLPS